MTKEDGASMNPTNEQELRELAHIIMNADTPYDAMQFVKDHTNAEIAKVLDRLEIEMPSKRNTLVGDAYQRTFCNEYNKALKEVSKVIQAERAKLKEVK